MGYHIEKSKTLKEEKMKKFIIFTAIASAILGWVAYDLLLVRGTTNGQVILMALKRNYFPSLLIAGIILIMGIFSLFGKEEATPARRKAPKGHFTKFLFPAFMGEWGATIALTLVVMVLLYLFIFVGPRAEALELGSTELAFNLWAFSSEDLIDNSWLAFFARVVLPILIFYFLWFLKWVIYEITEAF